MFYEYTYIKYLSRYVIRKQVNQQKQAKGLEILCFPAEGMRMASELMWRCPASFTIWEMQSKTRSKAFHT